MLAICHRDDHRDYFHGWLIQVEGDLRLKHMMRLALAKIAISIGTIDDFFLFICSQSLKRAVIFN